MTQNGVSATTTYLYGLDGIIADTDGTGTTHYHLQDGLSSTTQLTDSAGALSWLDDRFGPASSASECGVWGLAALAGSPGLAQRGLATTIACLAGAATAASNAPESSAGPGTKG